MEGKRHGPTGAACSDPAALGQVVSSNVGTAFPYLQALRDNLHSFKKLVSLVGCLSGNRVSLIIVIGNDCCLLGRVQTSSAYQGHTWALPYW